MTRLRQTANPAVCVVLGLALQAPAQTPLPAPRAEPAVEVERLLRSGRADEALARVDRALADKPGDAQLRFLRGVGLTDAGRGDEAIAAFVTLTQDYPELAEPYNNLAVLYAGRGLYEKAREALQTALRNQPGYATAHENLGDVYARLAAASYARAQQLDARSRGIDAKLAALRNVFVPTAAAILPGPAAR